MTTEYAKESFLDAKGRRLMPGDKAPDESADNLKHYRALGLIGAEAAVEAATGIDVGRRGKAATRKTKAKPAE